MSLQIKAISAGVIKSVEALSPADKERLFTQCYALKAAEKLPNSSSCLDTRCQATFLATIKLALANSWMERQSDFWRHETSSHAVQLQVAGAVDRSRIRWVQRRVNDPFVPRISRSWGKRVEAGRATWSQSLTRNASWTWRPPRPRPFSQAAFYMAHSPPDRAGISEGSQLLVLQPPNV